MNESDIPELPGRPGAVPLQPVSRRDRAQDEAWIREFLRSEAFGFLAMTDGGRPSLASNLFVFDPQTHPIYLHSARAGATSTVVERGGPDAFSVAGRGRLLPAAEVLELSVE
jgi:nitroimidazol reductase NimA-like FMN-containing flavoprotein (pyridoxamine 5'-phosphate oxidase superfamily)